MAGRISRAALAAVVAACGLTVAIAGTAAAVTSVTTESELRAALADPATTVVVLGQSIDLTDCSAGRGDLDRAGALTIDGAGFTIRQTCPGERVLESTSGTLTLQHVTITGGDQAGPTTGLGGGVRAAGDLALLDTTVTGNRVTATGAFFFAAGGGVAADGTITIIGSHVDENAVITSHGFGGGVYDGTAQTVTVSDSSVEDNTLTCASSTGVPFCAGGGVASAATSGVVSSTSSTSGLVASAATSHVTLVRSSVSGNTAASSSTDAVSGTSSFTVGGGVFADAVDATGSHVDRNRVSADGGLTASVLGAGIGAGEAARLRSSSVDDNVATATGADGGGATGGVVSDVSVDAKDSSISRNHVSAETTTGSARAGGVGTGHLTLDHVTVRDNAVEGPSAYAGGALAVTADTVDTTIADNVVRATVNDAFAGGLLVDRGGGQLRSTTISGNLVHGPAGAHGGGLDHADRFAPLDTPEADLTLVNTTITGNTAESTELDSYAGGIEEAGVESLALLFSTVSGNSADVGANLAGADATAAAAPDSGTIELTATVVSEALGGGANCAAVTIAHSAFAHVTDTSCGTATSADPQLGTLADNGGPTLTMLPTTASPLVGQVPTDACLARVAVDQRGVTRPQGTACTIGAVEVAGPVIPDPPLTPPDVPTTPAAGVATAPTAIVAEPRFTG